MNKPTETIQAIICDLDGLLVDTETLYAQVLKQMAKERDRQFGIDEHRLIMGRPAKIGTRTLLDHWSLDEDPIRFIEDRNARFDQLADELGLAQMTGAQQLLDFIQDSSYRCALVSGSDAKEVVSKLEDSELKAEFELRVTGDMVKHGKPDPEPYELALKGLELRGSATIVLEDSVNGSISSHEAGCFTIAVPNSLEDQSKYSAADIVMSDLNQVLGYLKEL